MWGFSHLIRNVATKASKTSLNTMKQSSYTPIQKIWANMQTTSLQSRALNLPSLSTLTIFNLREILERALEEGELPSAIKGMVLQGTNIGSIIKSFLSYLEINHVSTNTKQPHLLASLNIQ